jgi:DNA replication and repair protein RecF
MKITKLQLKNFRNHADLTIEFDQNSTLIVGPNGAGKTNILESIYLLSTAKSPRSRYDKDLIAHGKKFCTINADTLSENEEKALELQVVGSETHENVSRKRVKVNKIAKTHKDFIRTFNTVLFMPEDIRIITGSPSRRRKYIDLLLSQLDYGYKKASLDYVKALRQRNRLLETIRNENRGWKQLEFWNSKILEKGQYIQARRLQLFDFLKEAVSNNGNNILDGGRKVEIKYIKSEISEGKLYDNQNKEIAAGTTLSGPHRDDFEIWLDDYDIAQFGSRGQQRSALLALKLSEIEFIEKNIGERPVLLLDDIFSELDVNHRESVLNTIDKQQTVITSTFILPDLEKPTMILDLKKPFQKRSK